MISQKAFVGLGCLLVFAFPGKCEELPESAPVDSATIAAYEELGAAYGGFLVTGGRIMFEGGKAAADKYLPGYFSFRRCPKRDLQDDCRRLKFSSHLSFTRQV